jgi:hypothetical protein
MARYIGGIAQPRGCTFGVHAEMIVRRRLLLLQDSVDKTIGAFNRSERGGP